MRGSRTSNPTIAGKASDMTLTREEKERLTDSRLKLQSIANSLKGVDPKKVPDYEDIEECLEDADKSLRGVLRSSESDPESRR